MRDYVQVKAEGKITAELADRALAMLEIDRDGFDQWDKRIIETLIHKFNGGPVGLNSLAVAVGEEAGTIEEVNEPYLIMEGYIKRTAQGRVATANAYRKARPQTARRRAAGTIVGRFCETPMASGTDAPTIPRWTLSVRDVGRFTRMQLTSDLFPQTSKVFTVGELTRQIRGTLETKFRAVWVQGEISNYKLHPSGHQYFTLKDQRAQIACVIWRDTIAPPRQPLVDGSAGAGLRHRHGFRSARTISAECPDSSAARSRPAAGEIRSAQAQTRSRRIVRSRNANGHCQNFRGESESSPRRAARRFATC